MTKHQTYLAIGACITCIAASLFSLSADHNHSTNGTDSAAVALAAPTDYATRGEIKAESSETRTPPSSFPSRHAPTLRAATSNYEAGPDNVAYSEEELAVLREYPNGDLSLAIAGAEDSFLRADDQTRSDNHRRYILLLNLAGKVFSGSGPARTPSLVQLMEDYPAAADVERERIAGLPMAEQQDRMAAFKERFFATQISNNDERRN